MSQMMDMTGRVFGKIRVAGYSHSNNGAYWHCICECGSTSIVPGRSLRSGTTKSCGCGAIEQARRNIHTSADTRRTNIPNIRKLKDLLGNMRKRCFDPKNKRWDNYGGRGITICDEWLNDCRAFYMWANANGYQPGLQIDREDVNGNYEPGNCRFVDAVTQMNNTTRNHFVEWGGKRKTIAEWERELGFPPNRLQWRFTNNWSIERAMTQPLRGRK